MAEPSSSEPLLSEKQQKNDAQYANLETEVSDSEEEHSIWEPSAIDRRILDETEQEESLLNERTRLERLEKSIRPPKQKKRGRLTARGSRRLRQQAESNASTGLMYEVESGYNDTSSRSSSESLPLEHEKSYTEKRSYLKFGLLFTAIVTIFVLLLAGAFKVSKKSTTYTLNNGTHAFGPTTILISLDGLRADFLYRGLTPALNAFVASGVSPKYMLPSFPSLTFPNHFTLVTGLYPESHGIVSNQFWDPAMQEEFYYTNISNSMQPKWWNAEPIWVTAEKQGMKTAIHMWPGSEAHVGNMDPTYMDKYNGSEALDVKVDRILQWLDLPQKQRPQFIGAYVPNVDADGHKYGPNSTQIRKTIVEVDVMLASLMDGLFQRNLANIVNVVIVSDHGMATTSTDRLYQLDDFIDMDLIDHMDGWPLRGLRLKDSDRDIEALHKKLLDASKGRAFEVYTRETMPERYHFSQNDRIAPLWVVPDAGWVVIEKADFHVAQAKADGISYSPNGLHGYDHEHPLMRAIFVARGPAFPHSPNSRIPVFQNVDVYNIVCDSLMIQPHPNNGTLRLPLKPDGLHSEPDEALDTPPDPVQPTADNSETSSMSDGEQTSSTPTGLNDAGPAPTSTATDVETVVVVDGDQPENKWLDYLRDRIQKAKDWAKHFLDSFGDDATGAEKAG